MSLQRSCCGLVRPARARGWRARWMMASAVMAGLGGARGAVATPNEFIWNGPLSWNVGAGSPQTASDNATVLSGQVTLDASYSIGAFTLGGGRLDGPFDLSAGGLFTWSGGAIIDSGTVRASGGVSITGATAKIL